MEQLLAKGHQCVRQANCRNFIQDLIFVIGTSAQVYPAAGYIGKAKRLGARVVTVNPEAEDLAELYKVKPGDFAFGQDAAKYLPILLEPIIGKLQADNTFRKADEEAGPA